MNCSEAEYLSPLYWSGELDARVAADLEQHLAACSDCATDFKRQQQYDALLRATIQRMDVDPSAIQARVRQRISSAPSRWPAHYRRWLAVSASGAVAAAMLVLGVFLLRHSPSPQPVYSATSRVPSPTIYEDAADDHRDEVVQGSPREWVYRGAEMDRLLRDQLGAAGDIAALTPDGYALDRARVCELLRRDYLHLVYKRGTSEISMFVRRRDGEDLTGPPVEKVRGRDVHADTVGQLQVAGFQSATLTVLYVGSVPREQMVRFASAAAASQTAMLLTASGRWGG